MTELIDDQDRQMISDAIEQIASGIISSQEKKGLKASGLSSQILRTNIEQNIFQIIDGSGSFEFQEFGRAAGLPPPFNKLYEWVGLKKYGINYKDDKERTSIAWALRKKIENSGTYTYITKKPTGVLTDNINNEAIQSLVAKLANKKAREVATGITRIFLENQT